MNKVYNIKIKTLTPVHIWDWNTLSGLDYFCYQERIKKKEEKTHEFDSTHISWLYKFDIEEFINILDEGDRQKFQKVLKDWNVGNIRWFMYQCLEASREIKWKKRFFSENIKYKEAFLKLNSIKKVKTTNTFYNHWKDKILWQDRQSNWKSSEALLNEKENQKSQMNIKTLVNSMWRYYIPWSSLKWALRTVLSNTQIEDNFKNHKVEKDPFKKLIVQDSDFLGESIIIVDSIARLWNQQWKNKQWNWQFAEFVPMGVEVNNKILVKDFLDESKLEYIDFDIILICKKAKEYLINKIEKYNGEITMLLRTNEDLKWSKESTKKKKKKLETVKQWFDEILSEIEYCKENECILSIWFWTWYWFKMIDWIKEKHPWKPKHLIDTKINIPLVLKTFDLSNVLLQIKKNNAKLQNNW